MSQCDRTRRCLSAPSAWSEENRGHGRLRHPQRCRPPSDQGEAGRSGRESGGRQEEDEDGEERSRSRPARAGISQRDRRWKTEGSFLASDKRFCWKNEKVVPVIPSRPAPVPGRLASNPPDSFFIALPMLRCFLPKCLFICPRSGRSHQKQGTTEHATASKYENQINRNSFVSPWICFEPSDAVKGEERRKISVKLGGEKQAAD